MNVSICAESDMWGLYFKDDILAEGGAGWAPAAMQEDVDNMVGGVRGGGVLE